MPIKADSNTLDYIETWENEVLSQTAKTKFSEETIEVLIRGLTYLLRPKYISLLIHQYDQDLNLEEIYHAYNHNDAWTASFEKQIVSLERYPHYFTQKLDQLQVFNDSTRLRSDEDFFIVEDVHCCWCYDISDSNGYLIARFLFFFDTEKEPTELNQRLIKKASLLLSILIQQKSLQDKVLKNSETFSLISSATNDAIWDWNCQTNRLWWSEGFEKLFGHKRSELSAFIDSWTTLIHPDDHDRVVESIEGAKCSGKDSWIEEYRFKNSVGEYLFVVDQGHIVRGTKGEVIRLVGGMRDITVRKKNQEVLSEQAALLNLARDAIIVRDLNHRVLYWNKGAEKVYGYSAEEALGIEINTLLRTENEEFLNATKITIEKGEWGGQLQQVSKSGKLIRIEGSWTLLRDDKGRPKSILVINTDITDQVMTQTQLMRAQRFESVNTLTSGIAHNLNNCLTPILLSVHQMKEKEELRPYERTLSIIERSALRSTAMIRQLMKYSQGYDLNIKEMSPNELIDEIIHLTSETFPKRITICSDICAGLYKVKADAGQLHQVILNLLINARDAIKENGQISIKGENVTLNRRTVGLNTTCGEFVKISITDTGHGMDTETIERIFDPFFTTKETDEGTGLGLSTSHTIVKNHHGFINVISSVGKGSTFEIYLPFKEDLCILGEQDNVG